MAAFSCLPSRSAFREVVRALRDFFWALTARSLARSLVSPFFARCAAAWSFRLGRGGSTTAGTAGRAFEGAGLGARTVPEW